MGMDSVYLVLAIEEAFNIEFTNEETRRIFTVGEMYAGVLRKLNESASLAGRKSWTEEQVWAKLKEVILNEAAVTEEQITMNARFAEDLGID